MKKILIVNFDSLFDIAGNKLRNGIDKLLDGIKDEFILILLAENKDKHAEDIKTLTNFFKDIFYLDDIKEHLADLYIFELILQKYNATKKEINYIGNNLYVGFIPCKIIGITSIHLITDQDVSTKPDISIEGDILCKNIFHAINHVRKYF